MLWNKISLALYFVFLFIFWNLLYICDDTTPGLPWSGVLTLEQLQQGLIWRRPPLCIALGFQSARMAHHLLDCWRERQDAREWRLLIDHCSRTTVLVWDGLYQELWLRPVLGGHAGQLLCPFNPDGPTLYCADRRALYVNCVKVLNRTKLQNCLPVCGLNKSVEEKLNCIGEFFTNLLYGRALEISNVGSYMELLLQTLFLLFLFHCLWLMSFLWSAGDSFPCF